VTPGFYHPPLADYPFYPGYADAWLGYWEPPHVYQYDVYVSETSLYDMRTGQLVWTGTVQTTAPGDITRGIKQYVNTVVKALRKEHLVA
jgi:hypothetical protein